MAVVVPGCSVVPPPLNGVPGDTVVSGGVAVVVVAGSFVVPRPRKGVLTAFVVASRVDDVVVSFSVVSWLRGVRLEAIFVACCMAVVAIVGRSVVTGLPRDVLNASVAKGVVSARGAFPAGRFVFVVRVLRRAGIAGILPAGVWLCRLRRKFGRFLPAGKFCWFSFLPAGDHRASLKRLKELEHSRFPFLLLKQATGRSSSCLKAHLLSLSVRVGQPPERRSRKPRRCVSNHVQVTQNAPRHFRSTQCCTLQRVACSRGLAARR